MRCRFIGKFWQLALMISILMFSPVVTRAQRAMLWQDAVKPDRINVYSQASTSGSVVRTLSRGQLVNVVLEIRVQ